MGTVLSFVWWDHQRVVACRLYNDEVPVVQDLDTEFHLPKTTFIGGKDKTLPLREIISRFESGSQTCNFTNWWFFLSYAKITYPSTAEISVNITTVPIFNIDSFK
jgi:hypothetical protein